MGYKKEEKKFKLKKRPLNQNCLPNSKLFLVRYS